MACSILVFVAHDWGRLGGLKRPETGLKQGWGSISNLPTNTLFGLVGRLLLHQSAFELMGFLQG